MSNSENLNVFRVILCNTRVETLITNEVLKKISKKNELKKSMVQNGDQENSVKPV